MNETEKDRILRMVSEGIIKPGEAAQLLAALTEETPAPAEKPKETAEEKPKPPMTQVQMQRPDGTNYVIEVPPGLVPALMKTAGVYIKEASRTAAQEAWSGLKVMVKNKTEEVKDTVKTKVTGGGSKQEAAKPVVDSGEAQRSEARFKVLQMVQNGRITAEDASRLIQQMDALHASEKKAAPAPSAKSK